MSLRDYITEALKEGGFLAKPAQKEKKTRNKKERAISILGVISILEKLKSNRVSASHFVIFWMKQWDPRVP